MLECSKCHSTNFTILKVKTGTNLGKPYYKCNTCGNFCGWVENEIPKPPVNNPQTPPPVYSPPNYPSRQPDGQRISEPQIKSMFISYAKDMVIAELQAGILGDKDVADRTLEIFKKLWTYDD